MVDRKQVSFDDIDIEIDQQVFSSLTRRLLAFAIDLLLLGGAYTFSAVNVTFINNLGLHVVLFMAIFALKLLPEIFYRRSLGKKLLGLQLVEREFRPPSWDRVLLKNALFILYMGLSFGLGLVELTKENAFFRSLQAGELGLSLGMISSYLLFGIFLVYLVNLFCAGLTTKRQSLLELLAGLFLVQGR